MKIELRKKVDNRMIDSNANIKSALKQMDRIDKKLLLVFEGEKFINILSIGDIQRSILRNQSLDTPVKDVLRENTRLATTDDSLDQIKSIMREHRIECMPIVDKELNLVDVYFWEDFFAIDEKQKKLDIKIPVVIMAGGKGTRMKPLTNVIPKPLIPIGDKTIIEEIMDRFVNIGCQDFFLSVNYKSKIIKHYFETLDNTDYQIEYFQEDKPLGTAGSLFLIKDKIKSTFFVSNCDIIIEEDYTEILDYHLKNSNELTIVTALKHYPIPYGTVLTSENGLVEKLTEKPELVFQINTGMYILEPHLLNEIPENEFFHITHLIEKIKKRKGRVGGFPISEGSWKDIGEWDEYLKQIFVSKK